MSDNNQQGNEYSVDLVICIDGTGSMASKKNHDRMIDKVKASAKDFYMLFYKAMKNYEPPKLIKENHFRVKVIVFRDFADTSTTPLEVSPFFNLQDPTDTDEFCRFVDSIEAKGGGDIPENALEAIATALQTEWEPSGGRYRRQAILVFTDTCTYDLKNPARVESPDYPIGMPDNIEELLTVWENGDQELAPAYSPKNGRLIIFAPDTTEIGESTGENRVIDWGLLRSWDRTWVVPVDADGGCAQVDLEQAMDVLVGSF